MSKKIFFVGGGGGRGGVAGGEEWAGAGERGVRVDFAEIGRASGRESV